MISWAWAIALLASCLVQQSGGVHKGQKLKYITASKPWQFHRNLRLASLFKYHKPKKVTFKNDTAAVNKTLR